MSKDEADHYGMPDAEPDAPMTSLWVNPDMAACPVILLGYEGGKVVFALPGGELRFEIASKIPGMLQTDIFVCREGQQFLGNWRGEDGKFMRDMCTKWFNRGCREAGKWDRNRPVRGYGLWPSKEGPILHVGDAIGQWPFEANGWRSIADALRDDRKGAVWRLGPPVPRPTKAATVDVGRKLRKGLDLWNWRALGQEGLTEADVAIGWQGQALLGACAPFRVHMAVSGSGGAGKTTLSQLMQAIGSALAGPLLDSFSDAGLRNSLSGEARALYLDETEPSVDGMGPVEKALELLRRMSTGEGSNRRQGDTGGVAVAQTAVGAGWLASIYPVPLNPAMTTRVVEAALRPLGAAKGGVDDEIKALIAWAEEVSPSLLARAIREAERYRQDVSHLKAALGKLGQSPRAADLVAALAAGRRLLLDDSPLTAESAIDEVKLWLALVRGREQTTADQNAGQACLGRIFSLNSGKHSHDRHLSIGELIQTHAKGDTFVSDADKVLKNHGLRVENNHAPDLPGWWLLVSTNHEALKRGMAGTQFGNWTSVLDKYLPELGESYAPRHMPTPIRFGMHQSRALAVPLAPWLEEPNGSGVGPVGPTPFDPPEWDAAPAPASRPASHGETHDR